MAAASPALAAPGGDEDYSRRLEEKCAQYLNEYAAPKSPPPSLGDNAMGRPALAKQLRTMAARDQEARNVWIALPEDHDAEAAMRRVDVENLMMLRHILSQDGFPTRAMVGPAGVQDAWLLVQHADDLKLQKNVLAQLHARVLAGDVGRQEYALLTDRILTNEGKPQIYGTQFNDDLQLLPTRDPSHLDARRRAMGLPSMAAYRCSLQVFYRK